MSINEFLNDTFQTVLIKDLFEYVGRGSIKINNSKEGPYALISATSQNNGIIKYIDSYKFEGDLVTVSIDGSIGYTFIQHGKFNVTSHIHVLRPLFKNNLEIICAIMTLTFSKKYTWPESFTRDKLMNESIDIPSKDFSALENEIKMNLYENIKEILVK